MKIQIICYEIWKYKVTYYIEGKTPHTCSRVYDNEEKALEKVQSLLDRGYTVSLYKISSACLGYID